MCDSLHFRKLKCASVCCEPSLCGAVTHMELSGQLSIDPSFMDDPAVLSDIDQDVMLTPSARYQSCACVHNGQCNTMAQSLDSKISY